MFGEAHLKSCLQVNTDLPVEETATIPLVTPENGGDNPTMSALLAALGKYFVEGKKNTHPLLLFMSSNETNGINRGCLRQRLGFPLTSSNGRKRQLPQMAKVLIFRMQALLSYKPPPAVKHIAFAWDVEERRVRGIAKESVKILGFLSSVTLLSSSMMSRRGS
jgi:hypothetical protein